MAGLDFLVNNYERAEFLAKTLISFATNDPMIGTKDEYIQLRKYFLDNSDTKELLPSWIRTSRSINLFWQFIKHKFSHYDERRHFIWSEMEPLLDYCEFQNKTPSEKSITEVLERFDESGIHNAWQKALDRKSSDPEGAITISRTLLESVCKHILDQKGIQYSPNKVELAELYKKTAQELNLSPSQHEEGVFKQILGGCSGVVNGLGSLRNKLGDAHGKGVVQVKPAPRHAELAVNLAGSMSLFLLETYKAVKKSR